MVSTRGKKATDAQKTATTPVVKKETTKKRARNGKVKAKEPEVKDEEPEVKDEEPEKPPEKKQKDGQKANSDKLVIPVDEGCSLQGSHSVHIGNNGLIYDASLNQTNSGHNNNKFYRIQLLASKNGDYRTWTRWGRVGDYGQSALLGNGDLDGALGQFDKKFKDKTGHKWVNRLDPPKKGKYTFIERDYEPDSDDSDGPSGAKGRGGSKDSLGIAEAPKKVESKLEIPVQKLMELIFNQQFFTSAMAEMSYDAQKLPLGKLSKRTLNQGFQALKDLAELIVNPSLAAEVHNMEYRDAISAISDSYYTYIPHVFGRNRPPIISNDDMLKKEINLLESLSDMSIADEIMKQSKESVGDIVHHLDRQYSGLGLVELTSLDHKSTEFKQLKDYMLKTHGSTHYMKFQVEEIFRLERHGETDRFIKSEYGNMKADRRLLWHGSRCTNYGGILSQGLRIAPPEAPVSGYMFGKGVYLADISSKSAGYTAHQMSGGIGLLLLCEAELGKPMLELTNADSNAAEVAKKNGSYATWGKGQTAPKAWKDAGCVNENLKGVMMPDTSHPPADSGVAGAHLAYNEFICYDVAQIRLRYLFRVKIT